ncbi:MAG: cation:proton antiporter [Hydrogenophilales bacterium]|nr:cation:proton antiporter [Hydrogenophilales bacterium]
MPLPIHELLLMFAVLLAGAALMGALAGRLGIPPVVGELLAGLLLGPSLLGWVEPAPTLKAMAEIGVALLLFEVGMDTDLYRLTRAGSKPVAVALAGFVFPAVGAYAAAYWLFDLQQLVSLFIAATLTATSIGITVRVLKDLGRKHSEEARIVLGAAVLDDVLGVIALAFLYQIAVKGEASFAAIAPVTLYILLFMLLAPIAAKGVAWIIGALDRRSDSPALLLTLVVALVLAFSALAHAVGAPILLGGFAAGIALGRTFRVELPSSIRLPFRAALSRMLAADPDIAHRVQTETRPLVHLFAPVFFVLVGVSINLRLVDWHSPRIWMLFGVLLALALIGKWLSGFVIREARLRQHAIGLCMIPRGEVGLIFAQLGLTQGILDDGLYAALLLVILFTTFLPPFLLKGFYALWGNHPALRLDSPARSPQSISE